MEQRENQGFPLLFLKPCVPLMQKAFISSQNQFVVVDVSVHQDLLDGLTLGYFLILFPLTMLV